MRSSIRYLCGQFRWKMLIGWVVFPNLLIGWLGPFPLSPTLLTTPRSVKK